MKFTEIWSDEDNSNENVATIEESQLLHLICNVSLFMADFIQGV